MLDGEVGLKCEGLPRGHGEDDDGRLQGDVKLNTGGVIVTFL